MTYNSFAPHSVAVTNYVMDEEKIASHAVYPAEEGISVCDLCIDIVTDLDQWLTEEHTEADIVRWVEQVPARANIT